MSDVIQSNININQNELVNDEKINKIRNSENFYELAISNFENLSENAVYAFCSPFVTSEQVHKVVDFLKTPKSKIIFLEFCIYEKQMKDISIHQLLLEIFLNELHIIDKTSKFSLVNKEKEPYKTIREKFLHFIRNTTLDLSSIIDNIPDYFVNEKLAVLEKCNKYEEASNIIVEYGKSFDIIVDLCKEFKNPMEIYTQIIKKTLPKELFLKLLNEKGDMIDISQIIPYLPNDVKFHELTNFFDKVVLSRTKKINDFKNQHIIDEISIISKKLKLQKLESGSIEISEDTLCGICEAPIGFEDFFLTPENLVIHTKCFK